MRHACGQVFNITPDLIAAYTRIDSARNFFCTQIWYPACPHPNLPPKGESARGVFTPSSACQPLKSLSVLGRRLRNHLIGQARCRRCLIPRLSIDTHGLQPVADKLLSLKHVNHSICFGSNSTVPDVTHSLYD